MRKERGCEKFIEGGERCRTKRQHDVKVGNDEEKVGMREERRQMRKLISKERGTKEEKHQIRT